MEGVVTARFDPFKTIIRVLVAGDRLGDRQRAALDAPAVRGDHGKRRIRKPNVHTVVPPFDFGRTQQSVASIPVHARRAIGPCLGP